MHEQSETIQRPDGKWINVYGRKLPKRGQQLPGSGVYDTVDEAEAAARKRSESFSEERPSVKTWEEVRSSDAYKKLSPEEKEAAREQYFNEVVAPKVDDKDLEAARVQFDTSTRGRIAPTKTADMDVDPTAGMSDWQKRLAGYGSTAPTFLQGAGKLARDVAELVPGGKSAADVVGLPTAEDIAERRRLDAPLAAAGSVEAEPVTYAGPENALGGRLGVHRGTYSQGIIPGPGAQGMAAGNAMLTLPLAIAPGASTVLGATGYGAAYGAAMPAETWAERAKNALAVGGTAGAITGAARALPALKRSFYDPLTETGRERMALDTVNRFARDPNAVRNALSRPAPAGAPAIDELVPGSRATLAEVTGDPGIAQAQRASQAASQDVANDLAANRTARQAARKDALIKQFGIGDKRALEATRDATAARLYRDAWNTPIDQKAAKAAAPEVRELLARPSIRAARREALDLAREEGEVLKPSDLKGGSVKGLHYMKRALDSQIDRAKAAGDGNLERLVGGTREKLLGVIDELSPAYKSARAEYSKASKPINQAEIGSYLYDKLFPALTDLGAERITPQAYAKVLKEGDQMAKRATGFSGARLRDILTTDQWNTIINLGKDVARETAAAERGRVPGSPTAQYLAGRNVLRQILGPVGLPETWSEKMGADLLANRWTSLVAQPVERDVQNKLAVMLADPREAARVQAAVDARRNALVPRVARALTRRALPPAAVAAGTYAAQPDQ